MEKFCLFGKIKIFEDDTLSSKLGTKTIKNGASKNRYENLQRRCQNAFNKRTGKLKTAGSKTANDCIERRAFREGGDETKYIQNFYYKLRKLTKNA